MFGVVKQMHAMYSNMGKMVSIQKILYLLATAGDRNTDLTPPVNTSLSVHMIRKSRRGKMKGHVPERDRRGRLSMEVWKNILPKKEVAIQKIEVMAKVVCS